MKLAKPTPAQRRDRTPLARVVGAVIALDVVMGAARNTSGMRKVVDDQGP
ncbi:MAG: hypothetical protein WBV77_06600 [Solirubrobacteraceae bacterium]